MFWIWIHWSDPNLGCSESGSNPDQDQGFLRQRNLVWIKNRHIYRLEPLKFGSGPGFGSGLKLVLDPDSKILFRIRNFYFGSGWDPAKSFGSFRNRKTAAKNIVKKIFSEPRLQTNGERRDAAGPQFWTCGNSVQSWIWNEPVIILLRISWAEALWNFLKKVFFMVNHVHKSV